MAGLDLPGFQNLSDLLKNPTNMVIGFEIAGIRFWATCDTLQLLEAPGPTYREFLRMPGQRRAEFDIQITCQWGDASNLQEGRSFFDVEKWKVCREEDGNYLLLRVPEGYAPVCLARINKSINQANIVVNTQAMYVTNMKQIFSELLYSSLSRILLMYYLAQHTGVLIHAAVVDLDGKGYLFPGRSGAGKSTLVRQFALKKRGRILNDDRAVIRKIEQTFYVFGTPWANTSGIAVNAGVPLAAAFFVSQDAQNIVKKISTAEILGRLLPTIAVPWADQEVASRILACCEDLIAHAPIYDLKCTPTEEVVDVVEQFIAKEHGIG